MGRTKSEECQKPQPPLLHKAKGTPISEPRFSAPCEMRFFPREKGKTAFLKKISSTKAVFPFSRGKNRISQGAENRGSLISVPLALRAHLKERIAIHLPFVSQYAFHLYRSTFGAPML